jgi:hypothetical protein
VCCDASFTYSIKNIGNSAAVTQSQHTSSSGNSSSISSSSTRHQQQHSAPTAAATTTLATSRCYLLLATTFTYYVRLPQHYWHYTVTAAAVVSHSTQCDTTRQQCVCDIDYSSLTLPLLQQRTLLPLHYNSTYKPDISLVNICSTSWLARSVR